MDPQNAIRLHLLDSVPYFRYLLMGMVLLLKKAFCDTDLKVLFLKKSDIHNKILKILIKRNIMKD